MTPLTTVFQYRPYFASPESGVIGGSTVLFMDYILELVYPPGIAR